MISFEQSEIIDILSENLKSQPECVALSYALKRANETLVAYSKRTSVFAVIDTLPEEMLDILAIELRTQYYDESFSIDRKKALIKNTILWYHKAGTVAAVQEMIDNVFESGVVLEWFKTGGEPGTFTISTSDTITPELINKFNEVVDNVKNVRSTLVDIILGNKIEMNINIAMGITTHKVITLR